MTSMEADPSATALASLGDLVEDVVVRLDGPIQHGADTLATIATRRGGSAANVAVRAAQLGACSRFLGRVGTDAIGTALIDELSAEGVDMSAVQRGGSTGTIVALVDPDGERSMLTDRRACVDLTSPDPVWLDGVDILHVPFYSLVLAPLADSARTLIEWSHDRGIAISIDASSASLIEQFGVDRTLALLRRLAPDVLLANEDEGRVLRLHSTLDHALTVIKRGPRPALLHLPDGTGVEVPAIAVERIVDTTGAGDAFAAGFLAHPAGAVADPIGACGAGHASAAQLLGSR